MIQQPKRQQTSQIESVPSPVGGLNARDSYAAMPPTDAVVMDNMVPYPSYVAARSGSLAWSTGLPSAVNTLAQYSPPLGSRKLFSVSGTAVYDSTSLGAVGAPVVSTGITNSWWQHVNFGAGGGQYLCMVNGQDAPLLYNGTTWQAVTNSSTPIAITGCTPSNFVNVNVFQGRLFFIQKNSMQVYFLPLLSVGGAATMLDLSSQTTLGGYIVTMATWTVETTSGMTQMGCFITSEGEVLVYQGNDPSYASSWYQVGTFRMGRPIGYRCTMKMGSDVAVICADGIIPLSKALLTDREQKGIAISDKIQNLVNTDVQNYAGNLGWQVILYPIGNKIIVNVPNPTGTYQYVMNTLNQSWSRFTGWYANCFETMGDNLYYGAANAVYQADIGTTDNNNPINCVAVQAANYFGEHQQKKFNIARPILTANGIVKPNFQINTNFNFSPPSNSSNFIEAGNTPWLSPWGSPWTSQAQVHSNWVAVGGVGYCGSPAMSFSVLGANVSWQATDVAFEVGNFL
jgi:hypothetical protein